MSSPQPPPPAGTGPAHGITPTDPKLELYKLEYERAAIRYEDIYRAVWQIFSYMSVISGALLTFGRDHLQDYNLFWFLVPLPLVFWFWGTYLPLDRYGKCCEDRLREIEDTVNSVYGTNLKHYSAFAGRRGRRDEKQKWTKRIHRIIKLQPRVEDIVRPAFLLLTAFWLYQSLYPLTRWVRKLL